MLLKGIRPQFFCTPKMKHSFMHFSRQKSLSIINQAYEKTAFSPLLNYEQQPLLGNILNHLKNIHLNIL